MNRTIRFITASTLPLLFTVGCVNTDSKPVSHTISGEIEHGSLASQQEENAINSAVKLAIHNMEGYQHQLLQQNRAATEVSTTTSEATEMTVLIIEEGVALDEPNTNGKSAEPLLIDEQIELEKNAPAMPDKSDFFFGFNKTEPNDSDKEILLQHASYLLANPDLVMVVSGHADNRGNKQYNQYLSERRAQNIADVLSGAGVPDTQLRVAGVGDNVPMTSARHWGENRRVELRYRDLLMLSRQ